MDEYDLSEKYIPYLEITPKHEQYNPYVWVNVGTRFWRDENNIQWTMQVYHGGSGSKSRCVNQCLDISYRYPNMSWMAHLIRHLPMDELTDHAYLTGTHDF